MKKVIALVLAAVLALTCFVGCGEEPTKATEASQTEVATTEETTTVAEETLPYEPNPGQAVVNNPMKEIPNYSLPEDCTIQQMREMAVKAFKDNLSVKWTPLNQFRYEKSGSVAREYLFYPNVVYAGVPYSNGCNGALTLLECYDFSNGVVYADLSVNANNWFGSSCSACASWGVCAVCTSVPLAFSTHEFVYLNGWYPLGGVTYPENTPTFKSYTTAQVVEANGEQKVYEGYAASDLGDLLISSGEDKVTDVHGMMVSVKPTVVRNADGTINGVESKLSICDQRATEYLVDEDGQKVSYRGRIDYEISFQDLLKKVYIAVTTKEFLGEKAYEKATVSLVKEVSDLDTLYNNTVKTNYRIVSVTTTAKDANGKVAYQQKEALNGIDTGIGPTTGQSLKSLISKTKFKKACTAGQTYTITCEVLLATGERFTVATFDQTF